MISVCMIVKDEEENLRKTLKSIEGLGFEIVIVDTGSVDDSRKIALQYTDKVFDYKWDNDFSAARNFAISKAQNDCVFVLDADEIIVKADKAAVEETVAQNKGKVGRIHRKNIYSRSGEEYVFNENVNRVFDKNLYMYKGKIHEQIISKEDSTYDTYIVPIYTVHNGYNNDEIKKKDKINRNITLLKECIVSNDKDPYLYYQLGKSYYMNSDYLNALDNFEKALDCNVDTKYEYVQDLVLSYGYSLINVKRYKESMCLLNLYEEYKWSADYLFLCGLIYMNNGIFNDAVNMFLQAADVKECSMEGVNDYLAYYNIGVICECLGNIEEAVKYYRACGNYKKALDRLEAVN